MPDLTEPAMESSTAQNSNEKHKLSSLPLQLGFIDFYEHEIKARLRQNPNQWRHFVDVLGKERIDEHLNFEFAVSHAAAEKLYDELVKSESNHHLLQCIMSFLKEVDFDLYTTMDVDSWEVESYNMLRRIILVADKLRPYMDIMHIVKYLSTCSFQLHNNYSPMVERWNKGTISDKYAQDLLLRTVPIMSSCSVYYLMAAICDSNEEARAVVNEVFPDFEMFYLEHIVGDRDSLMYVVQSFADTKMAVREIMNGEVKSAKKSSMFFEYIPTYHTIPLIMDVTEVPSLNLRQYQKELIQPALNGDNTVICAPTGSGKTIMAAYIVRDHIFKLRRNGKQPKVLFVVPSVPLVVQQKKVLENYLKTFAKIQGLRGGQGESDFVHTFTEFDIIVCTAQIVVNGTTPIKHVIDEAISFRHIDEFTLIVLDEAHHTNNDHPYNALMRNYHRRKYGNHGTVLRDMPQVIGLTASLGAPNNPKSVEEVEKYLISVCANFDAHVISNVVEHADEMKRYINHVKDEFVYIETNDESTRPFCNAMIEAITIAENALRNVEGLKGTFEQMIFSADFTSPTLDSYYSWLVRTRNHSLPQTTLPSDSMVEARRCIVILEKLFLVLNCVKCFPTDHALKQFAGALHFDESVAYEKAIAEKVEFARSLPTSECRIFTKLVSIIKAQFEEEPDSRVLVFLPLRIYCLLAVDILKAHTGIETGYVTGVNTSTNNGGVNPSMQVDVLRAFASGEKPILCATTVADEGLDISKCNLVIKYHFVTDEIAHVQRKGRARKLQSRCILMTGDPKINTLEKKNAFLAELVEQAHLRLAQRSDAEKRLWLTRECTKMNMQRARDDEERDKKKEIMAPRSSDFQILCKGCGHHLLNSEEVRTVFSNYVGYSVDIWKRVGCHAHTKSERQVYGNMKSDYVAHLHCMNTVNGKDCGCQLGQILIYKSVILPTLSCSQLIFVSKNNAADRRTYKQWKSVTKNLFWPDAMTPEELHLMYEENTLKIPAETIASLEVIKEKNAQMAAKMPSSSSSGSDVSVEANTATTTTSPTSSPPEPEPEAATEAKESS